MFKPAKIAYEVHTNTPESPHAMQYFHRLTMDGFMTFFSILIASTLTIHTQFSSSPTFSLFVVINRDVVLHVDVFDLAFN